jgi:hypothetical protein
MEQRYFEARAMFGGMAPGMGMFDGYRKGQSSFAGREVDFDLTSEWSMISPCYNPVWENSGRPARADILQWDQVGPSSIGRSM